MCKYFMVCISILALFVNCATGTGTERRVEPDLVAEQRIEIERQRQYINELERALQSGINDLRAAREHLNSLESTNIEFRVWLSRVDEFVREIIRIQSELERVQRTDRGENAGEGRVYILPRPDT